MPKFVFRSTTSGAEVVGSGHRVTETRELAPFERLEVHGPFDVEIVPGGSGPAELEGDDNLLPLARTDIDGMLLNVRLAADGGGSLSVETERPLSLRLPVRELSRIQTHSIARVRAAETLRSPRFAVEAHGSSQIELPVETDDLEQEVQGNAATTLSGHAGKHGVRASGSAEVHAFELDAEACDVRASGSSEVEVQASQRLGAHASGKARIAYRGDAAVTQSLSGKGRLERA
jgi:hypothetical protein